MNISNANASVKASESRVTCPPSWKKISTEPAYLTFRAFAFYIVPASARKEGFNARRLDCKTGLNLSLV